MKPQFSDSMIAGMVRQKMLELKALVLPLCRMEEENTFSKGLGHQVPKKDVSITRAKYTRSYDRSKECELGQKYYDICQVLIEALTKGLWVELSRLTTLDVYSDVHGVHVTSEHTRRSGDRVVAQDFAFTCDWREDLDVDMMVKISLSLTGSSQHVMIVDYIRNKAVVSA